MEKKYYLIVAVVNLMLSMVVSPAMALFEAFGSLIPSSEVTKAFDGYRIDPDLNYYYSGAEGWPDAIIGVNKAYILDSSLWSKVMATPEVFKNLVAGMKSRPLTTALHGYVMLDGKGRPIGVWYSMFGVRGYIKMIGERTVEIATPLNPNRPELRAP